MAPPPPEAHRSSASSAQPPAKNGILSAFPMFVPSLSWQNDRFYIYMAQKCRFSHRTILEREREAARLAHKVALLRRQQDRVHPH